MKQKIISLCIAAFMAMAQSYGGVTLTVPDVSIAPGGNSNVVIYFNFGTPIYTAYQMDISYPEGIGSVSGDDGNPAFFKGNVYSETHNVSSIYTTKGLDRFQCFSISSAPFTTQSGLLLSLPIKAQKSMAEGTYHATISPIEFVQTDATPDRPDAITFNITVTKNVTLDESSTMAPATAAGVSVTVRRTINADEWSTICLPFAMSAAQVKTAFGNEVQLADFTSWTSETDGKGNTASISMNFTSVDKLEANHPYIIKVTSPVSEFTVNDVDIRPDENPVVQVGGEGDEQGYFIGTYLADTEVPNNNLFLCENRFYYSVGKTKMKAFRAYFELDAVLADVEEAGAKIRFTVDGTVTSIESIAAGEYGQEDAVYDLSGRRLSVSPASSSLPKGMYVVNGKKLIVK